MGRGMPALVVLTLSERPGLPRQDANR